MRKIQFDPEKAVGQKITEYDRQQLCDFIVKLCDCILEDAGENTYCGGIYPENISIDDTGALALGLPSEDDWKGQEMDFLPPELYWNGGKSPASDVYSIGLLMYYSVTGGRLPFDDAARSPQLRRMSGESFEVPKVAGRRLGEIIGKATQFRPENRYQSIEQLRIMAENCLKDLYLNSAPSGENLFDKSDDDLTDIEKLMVGIIEKNEDTPIPVTPEEIPASEGKPVNAESSAEPETPCEVEPDDEEIRSRIEKLYNLDSDDIEPVEVCSRGARKPNVQYTKNAEREKRSGEEIRRRKRRPVAIILVLCAILVIASLLFNALIKDMAEDTEATRKAALALEMEQNSTLYDEDEPAASAVNPTPKIIDDEDVLDIPPDPSPTPMTEEPTNGTVPEQTGESVSEATAAPIPTEHGYELFVDNGSWEQAKASCEAMGGHLVVINDADEFAAITQLAQQYGIDKVWIGGHRENGIMVWEDGSTQVYEKWGYGEPSYFDGGIAEDYVLLWNNRGWVYNDSRNDPCKDYPNMYSGKLAYICEFGG